MCVTSLSPQGTLHFLIMVSLVSRLAEINKARFEHVTLSRPVRNG